RRPAWRSLLLQKLLATLDRLAQRPLPPLAGLLVKGPLLDVLGQPFLLTQLLESAEHLLSRLVPAGLDADRHGAPFLAAYPYCLDASLPGAPPDLRTFTVGRVLDYFTAPRRMQAPAGPILEPASPPPDLILPRSA